MNRTPLQLIPSLKGIFNRMSLCHAASLTAITCGLSLTAQAAIPITGTGTYAQNFDTLQSAAPTPPATNYPWADNSTLTGWYSNRTVYLVNNGAGNSGGLYSYGTTAVAERALGSVGSGSAATVHMAVVLQNTSAGALEIDSISYRGEQWRYGAPTAANSLTFAYAVSNSDITTADPALTFNPIPGLNFDSPVTTGTAGALDGNVAPNFTAKSATTQLIIPAGQYIILRWTDTDNAGADNGMAIDDLSVSYKPSAGLDTTPPVATSFSPVDEGPVFPVITVEGLAINFSEPVKAGASGTVVIKKASDDSVVRSFPVAEAVVSESTASYFFNGPSPLVAGTDYYVDITAGAIEDIAGNDFAGVSGKLTTPGNTSWTFSTAPPPAQPTVVINKFSNGSPDTVELLVTGNLTPGGTVDMRGMILKDFSSTNANDGGGRFEFSQDVLWQAVPVGTLVVLSNDNTATDTTSADFSVRVGLANTTYFTSLGNTFDIATSEIVMIKAAGSGAAGTTGGIHMLVGGAETSFVTNFPGAKVLAPTGGSGVVVNNTTSSIADYITGEGTNGSFDATGSVALTPSQFGVANTGSNAVFIANLRGQTAGDGDGVAEIINVTPGSPFANTGIFGRSQTAQSAKVVLNAFIPSVTLTNATVTVPSILGTPTTGTVSLSGPGASGASFSVAGQTITINSAAVTTDNALEVTITGLSTPAPNLVTDNGNYTFTTQTRASSGTLANLGIQPAAHVIIPISSIRDVSATGVPLDLGSTVAVEGVATEGNFGTENTQAYIQDSNAGVNIFSSTELDPELVRGSRYAVLGTVLQFQGVTEVAPASASDVVLLGTDTEPTPQTIDLATLLATPEAYEGKLIKVINLSFVSVNPNNTSDITVKDAADNTISMFFAGGSTATPPSQTTGYPINLTGILSQFDSSNPFTSGYQILPRDPSDIEPGTAPSGYAGWATTNGIPGELPTGDFDKDGITNLVEYALGLSPTVGGASPGTFNGSTVTFTKGAEAIANGDVDWIIQTSPTLGAAPSAWTNVTATEVGNTISYTLPTGQGKVFVRLLVNQL